MTDSGLCPGCRKWADGQQEIKPPKEVFDKWWEANRFRVEFISQEKDAKGIAQEAFEIGFKTGQGDRRGIPDDLRLIKPAEEYSSDEASEMLIRRGLAIIRGEFSEESLSGEERKAWDWDQFVLQKIADSIVPEDD